MSRPLSGDTDGDDTASFACHRFSGSSCCRRRPYFNGIEICPTKKIDALRKILALRRETLEATFSVDLGYGDIDRLSSSDRSIISNEVETALEDWDEADVIAPNGGLVPKTKLQIALSEYLALAEELSFKLDSIDIDDRDEPRPRRRTGAPCSAPMVGKAFRSADWQRQMSSADDPRERQ